MSLDNDPLVDDVLELARAAVAPTASDLESVLAGVRSHIAAMPVALREVPGPAAPRARARGPAPRALRWTAELRRWLGIPLSLAVGFGIGVQYAERRGHPQPPAAALDVPLGASDSRAFAAAPVAAAPQLAAASTPQPIESAASALTAAPAVPELGPARLRPALAHSKAQRRALAPVAGRALSPLPAVEAPQTRLSFADVVERVARAQRALAPAAGRSLSPPPAVEAPQTRLSFADVVERVARAQRAERDLSPELALRLLDELDARADSATLQQERLMTRVLAACDLGDVAGAHSAARELETLDPGSVYASRLGSTCIALKAPGGGSPASAR